MELSNTRNPKSLLLCVVALSVAACSGGSSDSCEDVDAFTKATGKVSSIQLVEVTGIAKVTIGKTVLFPDDAANPVQFFEAESSNVIDPGQLSIVVEMEGNRIEQQSLMGTIYKFATGIFINDAHACTLAPEDNGESSEGLAILKSTSTISGVNVQAMSSLNDTISAGDSLNAELLAVEVDLIEDERYGPIAFQELRSVESLNGSSSLVLHLVLNDTVDVDTGIPHQFSVGVDYSNGSQYVEESSAITLDP